MNKNRKIDIPKSVKKHLCMSKKEFAKMEGLSLKRGKSISNKGYKSMMKDIDRDYYNYILESINVAVKILVENPHSEHRNIDKMKDDIVEIILDEEKVLGLIKAYKRFEEYEMDSIIYLPYMIENTILYYEQQEDPKMTETVKDSLIEFSMTILRKCIKRYRRLGLDEMEAFKLATYIPTTKLFDKNPGYASFRLYTAMIEMAEDRSINPDIILRTIYKSGKMKHSKKQYILEFSKMFINQKVTSKTLQYTETQMELQTELSEYVLNFINELKKDEIESVLKGHIRYREKNENRKNGGGKYVIKFTTIANSNSDNIRIKEVVLKLLSKNSENELYLS